MRSYQLLLILCVFLTFACKQKNSTNNNNTEASNNSNASTTAKKWSQKDIDTFIDQCVQNSSENLNAGEAIAYCRCVQQKVQNKYPDIQSVSRISKAEMAPLTEACLTGDVMDPKDDDDLGTTSVGSWSAADKRTFKDNCVDGLITENMSPTKAITYCDCLLPKVMSVSPNLKDVEDISKATMTAFAKECLK